MAISPKSKSKKENSTELTSALSSTGANVNAANHLRIRSMYVRPIHSADIAFNLAGVISFRNTVLARLGKRVSKSSLTRLYQSLDQDAASLMQFDANQIRGALNNDILFSVRNESLALDLKQAIVRRHNLFLEQYNYLNEIDQAWNDLYPRRNTSLRDLSDALRDRYQQIEQKFGTTNIDRNTLKENQTVTTFDGSIKTKGRSVGMIEPQHTVSVAGTGASTHTMSPVTTTPVYYKGGAYFEAPALQLEPADREEPGFPAIQKLDYNDHKQKSGRDHDFWHPYLDNLASAKRNEIDLIDERFAHTIAALRLPHVRTILQNEGLDSTLEVRKLQLNYAHTFLLAPFDGLITAIYKDEGESVQPGEPVLRIEDDSQVLLIARVQYRGALYVGMNVSITTTDLFESQQPMPNPLSGTIVATRGHDSDDDEWEIIIECANPATPSGNRLLPVNYHFDKDTTQATLV